MQRRSHPFFSGIGCGAALFLTAALGAIIYFRGGIPFSPGRLAAAHSGERATVVESEFESHAAFEVDCGQCHVPWRGISAQRCQTCHVDVASQRNSGDGLHGRLPDSGRCLHCHTDHRGHDASLTTISADVFDHSVTAFSLVRHETDYQGTALACVECHVHGGYSAETVDCLTCHAEADADFMSEHVALFGDNCLLCHDGQDSMANFEHAVVFPLDGAHATAECEACHADRSFLQEAPRQCVDCHEEPGVHAGLFGLDCARCHTATAWTPAQLTTHVFPLDHGDQGTQECTVCHDQRYTEHTCYNCHEHDRAETREEHLKEGITDFAECARCHPTGQKDEAEGEIGEDDHA